MCCVLDVIVTIERQRQSKENERTLKDNTRKITLYNLFSSRFDENKRWSVAFLAISQMRDTKIGLLMLFFSLSFFKMRIHLASMHNNKQAITTTTNESSSPFKHTHTHTHTIYLYSKTKEKKNKCLHLPVF